MNIAQQENPVQIKPESSSGGALSLKRANELKVRGKDLHDLPEYALDPKKVILDFITPYLHTISMSSDKLFVVTYRRPEKTASGIIMTQSNLEEDKWQGVVGLAVKLGSQAFQDDAKISHGGFRANLHDWVTYAPVRGVSRDFCGLHCRILQDTNIDMVVTDPTLVW